MKRINNSVDKVTVINNKTKEIKNIRNYIHNTNFQLSDHFEKLGRHTFYCMSDNSENVNFDIDSYLKDIITGLNNIDSSNSMIQKIEDSLIEDIISHENENYQDGFENAKLILQEKLCYNEIGFIDFDYELHFTEKWFNNYEQIRGIRTQRRDKQISWAEMEQNINELLDINI